jgi:signal transduction histidine kinase
MVIGPALMSRSGWPFGMEIIPVGASVIGLAASWRLAIGIVAGAALTMGGIYTSGMAPFSPLVLQLAGNWLVTSLGLMYLLRQLLGSFDHASAELEASTVSLESARDEASSLAGQLAYDVKRALDTLEESLATSAAAVEAAAEQMLALLQEARRLRPPEPVLPSDEVTRSLRRMRLGLTRTLFVVGSMVLSAQIIRNSVAGRDTLAWLNAAELSAFLVVAAFHTLAPHRWRWSIQLLAGATTCIGLLMMVTWHRIEPGATVLPPVTMTLIVLALLGAVGGQWATPVIWTALFAAATMVILKGAVGPTLIVCVAYGAFGALIASLQERLLADVALRRKEASAAIRYRRRLIGALFHDLSNPLQAVTILVSPEGPHEGRTVPAEAGPLVRRMRGTLDSVMGRVQPPERLPLAEMLDALLSVFGARLATKRIAMMPAWDPGVAVRANRSLLQDTVLANLLSNAIKFSPTGGTITMRASRVGSEVHVELQDQGPGIPDEAMAALDAGQVAPSQMGSAGERGSGHGLLLARDYVEEMGGTLTFTRPPEGGVIARVVLPAA